MLAAANPELGSTGQQRILRYCQQSSSSKLQLSTVQVMQAAAVNSPCHAGCSCQQSRSCKLQQTHVASDATQHDTPVHNEGANHASADIGLGEVKVPGVVQSSDAQCREAAESTCKAPYGVNQTLPLCVCKCGHPEQWTVLENKDVSHCTHHKCHHKHLYIQLTPCAALRNTHTTTCRPSDRSIHTQQGMASNSCCCQSGPGLLDWCGADAPRGQSIEANRASTDAEYSWGSCSGNWCSSSKVDYCKEWTEKPCLDDSPEQLAPSGA